ncbi:MAG: regulatory iron-sulfur-containing complex subunit RicT [bacterium]
MSLVEIEFKGRRKGVYLNSRELTLKRDDFVIVSADRGEDLGRVILVGEEWQETLTRIHRLLDTSGNSNGNGKNTSAADGDGDNGNDSPAEEAAVEVSDDDTAMDDQPESAPEAEAGDEPSREESPPQEERTPAGTSEPLEGLPDILRLAGEVEVEQERRNRDAEREARQFFFKEVKRLNLEMKLVDIEYQLDRKKLTFYFTADGRVDFRELVKTLAQNFHTRIDLRQIGARDEAKRIGGVGICGRELCCATWIREFKPVTTSMLKEQGLLMNPQKNTGLCGKLRCCLRYEVDQYREVNRLFPREGMRVRGPRGVGVVEKVSMCHSSLGVKWEDGQRIGYSFDQVRKFTDWDHEKREEIMEILFHEDPSIIVQEREEREGHLVTSFTHEEKSDDDHPQKGRRKSRRSGHHDHSRKENSDLNRADENSAASADNRETEAQPAEQERGRKRLFKSRRGGRGRRENVHDEQKPASNAQGSSSAPQGDNDQERNSKDPSRKHRGDRHHKKAKQDRRGNIGKDKPTNANAVSKSDNRKNDQGGQSSQPSGQDDSTQKPKGQPIHQRGHRRRR